MTYNNISDKIQQQRARVYELIDSVAEAAAQELIDTLTYEPDDALGLAAKKLRNESANDLLDYAGYKVDRVEHSGTVQFAPLQISRETEIESKSEILEQKEENITKLALVTS